MNEITHEKLKSIKQTFRLYMNGPVSRSMNDKGLNYKINWGIPFANLKEMAQEYDKDKELAIELWKENIRECKIMATLIMPAEAMDEDLLDVWAEQVDSQEIAEMLAFNLLQHLDYARKVAFQWIAMERPMFQTMGYQLMARLFARGFMPDESDTNEFLDQVGAVLFDDGANIGVKHAASNSLIRFVNISDSYKSKVDESLLEQMEIK